MTHDAAAQPAEGETTGWDAIQLHPSDSVAVALRDLPAGCEVSVQNAGSVRKLRVRGAIDVGHKVALAHMPAGTVVLKYGEAIGRLAAEVDAGEHVHVHNLVSSRGRARADR